MKTTEVEAEEEVEHYYVDNLLREKGIQKKACKSYKQWQVTQIRIMINMRG